MRTALGVLISWLVAGSVCWGAAAARTNTFFPGPISISALTNQITDTGSGLAYNGTPIGGGGSQTPWTSDINGNRHVLTNASSITIAGLSSSTNDNAFAITNTQSAWLMSVNNAGNIGFGISGGGSNNVEGLELRGFPNLNTDNFGIRSTWQVGDAGTSLNHFAAMLGQLTVIPSATNVNPSWMAAVYPYMKIDGNAAIPETEAVRMVNRINGNTAYVTNFYGAYSDIHLTGVKSAASNIFHYYAAPTVKDGASNTVVNEYGLYVGGLTAATNTWAIYTAGSANKIHFEGPLDMSGNISMNGSRTIQADGTAALPGFATAGNANMGMFRSANNRLGWSTVGVERMQLDSNGNLIMLNNFGITLGGILQTNWFMGRDLPIQPTDMANSTCTVDSGGSGYQMLYAANQLGLYQFQVGTNWSGTLHIKGMYGMDVATSGTVILEADVWCMNSGDARAFTNPNYGTANLITNTVPGTIYFPQAFDIACANVGGTLQGGSWVKVKLTRTGTAGNNMALQSIGYWNQ